MTQYDISRKQTYDMYVRYNSATMIGNTKIMVCSDKKTKPPSPEGYGITVAGQYCLSLLPFH